ncbi:MAG: GNAT family N-acetyltransferase [Sulfuricella sp.]|nr:GNAT family N-acetyltransferase [Sulfuricella sp.]
MMEACFGIDPATHQDLPAMVELLGELFSIEEEFVADAEVQARGLRLILDTPALGRLFVLKKAGRVIGMASLLFSVSTARGGLAGVLEDVIVAAEFRRLKLGRRLIEHIRQWAAAQGIVRLTLLADRDNGAALGFYENEGFTRADSMVVYRYHLG